jgi:hypothetical protein
VSSLVGSPPRTGSGAGSGWESEAGNVLACKGMGSEGPYAYEDGAKEI